MYHSLGLFFVDRRGEEHSFIIKPAISAWRKLNEQDRRSVRSSSSLSQKHIKNPSSLLVSSKIIEEKNILSADNYAIMVSCRSNYTGTFGLLRYFFYTKGSQRVIVLTVHCFVFSLFYSWCRVKAVLQAIHKLATPYL